MKRPEVGLGEFLQTLDTSLLDVSSTTIQEAMHAELALEALGNIRQQLIKQNLTEQVIQFDRILQRKIKKTKLKSLFPNPIPPDSFAISAAISDSYASLLEKGMEFFSECYENGKTITISLGNKKSIVLGHRAIQPNCFMGTLQEFLRAVSWWKDPRTLQHWCCLWNWACKNQSFVFHYVPLSEILATVYALPRTNGKFCMRDRQAFSASLDFFHNATIKMPVNVEVSTQSGKKKLEQATRIFRLLNLDLAQKNKKGDVYLKIAGEFLPGLNPGKFRGRVFPNGIFELDANPKRDASRIILAYRLCNRLDQMNGTPLEWSKEQLIQAAGLDASYKQNKTEACKKLVKSLKRLVEVKCISGFSPERIATKQTAPVIIYPAA